MLLGISDRKEIRKNPNRPTWLKEIKLLLPSDQEVTCTLWGEKADLISESTLLSGDEPTTIILTSIVVKDDVIQKGSFKLSSTSATMIYVNLDVDECDELKNRFAGREQCTQISLSQDYSPQNGQPCVSVSLTLPKMTPLPSQHVFRFAGREQCTQISLSQDYSPQNGQPKETSIADLLHELQSKNCVGKKYHFIGQIIRVNDAFGWSYLSCTTCKGRAQKCPPTYWCGKCNTNIDHPINRYKLMLEIKDSTSTIKMVAFDKEADHLLGKTVDELNEINNQEFGDSKVKDIFKHLTGMDYNFFVKPNYNDYRQGGRSVAANRIRPISPTSKLPEKGKNINNEGSPSQTASKRFNNNEDGSNGKKMRSSHY